MTGIPGNELEHLLDATRTALASLGASAVGTPPAPAQGRGDAADGMIRATVTADGEVKSIEIAPRAMRMASEEIGEHVAEAVNAAFADLRSAPAAVPAMADTERLTAQVRAVQDLGMAQMRQVTETISDLMAQLHGGRR